MSEFSALILGVGVSAAAVIDVRTRRVPNEITFGLASCGSALATFHLSGISLATALAGLAAGLAMMLPGYAIGATGAGDVKLFAAACTFLGPSRGLTAFMCTLIAGGVFAVAAAASRGLLRQVVGRAVVLVRTGGANVAEIEDGSTSNRFAYAPAIAIGTLVAALGF
jgi:prepilin peptidase CpaA